ncbi:hypothetical protein Tco_0278083 [Tanacetum coccineum]
MITSIGIRHAKTYTLRERSSRKLGQSPAFVEANYEVLESLLRERRKEAGEKEMPKVVGLRRLKQGKMKTDEIFPSLLERLTYGKVAENRSTPAILFDLRTRRPPTFD